ncbi:MAG: ABC transporter permease [Candidatus Cloacimonetes bacterium]|nr:ABC transporter permease [Candidatus Cloacimonadota bacterium]
MIRHYLLLTWRHIKNQKIYAFLNIIGLATGLACFIIIMLWVKHEFSYDKHNEHYENLYLVGLDIKMGEMEGKGSSSSGLLAAHIVEDYPEVINAARIYRGINKLVSYIDGDVHHTENRVYYADSTIFDLFTIPVLKGDPREKLNRPLTMFITESIARKYFGDGDPIGKVMNFDGWWDYEVVGIIADAPETSHWRYDFLASNHDVERFHNAYWLSDNLTTYILLADGIDYREFENKLIEFRNRHVEPVVLKEIGTGFTEWEASGNRYRYYLDPVRSIYLNPLSTIGTSTQGSLVYVIVFIIIAIVILLIACINFMNLTTARAATRAREIGLRKVVGSRRWQIIRQLLLESVCYSLVSMMLAMIIVILVMPYFSNIAETNLSVLVLKPENIPVLLLLALIVGILAGSYSSILISSFKIATVLKGNIMQGRNKSWLRNSLVLVQFAISIIIIISTLVVNQQLKYISTKKLGFEKDQVLVIERAYSLKEHIITYKEEISKLPGVVAASITSNIPGSGANGSVFQKENSSTQDMVHFREMSGDYDYLKVLGIELKSGRFFSPDHPGDSLACVINETAVKNLGLQQPVGARIYYAGFVQYMNVIGVVADYHIESLHEKIPNLALLPPYRYYSHYFLVKMETGDIMNTVKSLKSVWNKFTINQPFAYFFMDEHFNNLHVAERRSGMILRIFSFLAIIIACLGLYGLAAFTAQQKNKEIGIRKVMGASVSRIIGLLLRQYTLWILLANLIAWPVAWYFMHKWLQNFAYAVKINIWFFVLAGLITLSIACITVGYQFMRAAMSDPVKTLKYE